MKSLLYIVIVMALCIFGIMLVGGLFYVGLEVVMYFYAGAPVSFEMDQFRRLFRMSLYGGGILGLGIGILGVFKVRGF